MTGQRVRSVRNAGRASSWRFGACLVIGLSFGNMACTTLEPFEMAPEAVQHKILYEDILVPGQRAKIVTADGQKWKITVKRIDAELGIIETTGDPVQVDEIVAVETREFSIGKTALLAAGTYSVLALIAVAIAPALLL